MKLISAVKSAVSVPFFSGAAVMQAVMPHEAYDAVREAFVAHARGEWTMPPKLYVTNYPAGDFRAMPALGGGHALLKWVTSFPGNPARGLPTVTGLVLLSDAETGAAPGGPRRRCGDGAPYGRGRRARGGHARPRGRDVVRRYRVRRERGRDGADARRARRRPSRLGRRPGAARDRRGEPRGARRRVRRRGARRPRS